MLKLKVCIFGRCYKMMLANRVVRRLTALKLMLCRKLSNLQYVFFVIILMRKPCVDMINGQITQKSSSFVVQL